MSKPSEAKITGWSDGHRVWFASTWDGVLLARKYAEYGVNMKIADHRPDAYGRILVSLGDGTPERIAKAHLRLTPPPGESGAREKAKETKAPVRKEAIDPALGTETTIFDHLERA